MENGENGNRRRSIPQRSADSKVLEAFVVRKIEQEQYGVITYEEMGKKIGRNVQADGRGILYGVERILLRERKWVFVTIHSVGIRLAKGNEFPAITERQIVHGRRKDRRELRKALCLPQEQYQELSPEERMQHDLNNTILALRARVSEPKAQKQIGELVKTEGRLIAAQRTIEHLAKS